jgi:hypothetical protein
VTDALGDKAERPAKRTDLSSSWSSMKRGSKEKSSGGKKDIVGQVEDCPTVCLIEVALQLKVVSRQKHPKQEL